MASIANGISRAALAARLRADGKSVEEISVKLGVSRRIASAYVWRGNNRTKLLAQHARKYERENADKMAASAAQREAREARDDEIAAVVDQGGRSYRVIGAMFGMSSGGVSNVMKRVKLRRAMEGKQ